MSNQKVAFVLVTHVRTEEALRTIRSVSAFATEGIDAGWYIADNNSNYEHVQTLANFISDDPNTHLIGLHSETLRPNPYHCGSSWNTGLQQGHEYSDYVLWLEDDWELKQPLDLRVYIRLMEERQDVGSVRLGVLAVNSHVEIVGHNGVHYLKYLKNTQYAYSGNPQLRHKRFLDAYGYFASDKNPGEIELDIDHRFRNNSGPDIWRPVDPLGGWGIFGHIGQEKSYK